MMPHTLPQSYVRWIRKQGAKELYVWQGVRVGATRLQLSAAHTTKLSSVWCTQLAGQTRHR